MPDSPKISVVMSVYNSQQYLHEAIDSILNQSFKDFEFIIIDDASTDSSAEIIKSYTDPRIKYHKNEHNLGLTKSLNKAIKLSESPYIARMDADDISLQKRLERQYLYLINHEDIAMVGTFGTLIDENGKEKDKISAALSPEEISAALVFYNQFIHSSVLYRKKVIVEAGLYNEEYKKAQDYELWLRLLSLDHKMVNLEESLVLYREHNESISVKTSQAQNDFSIDATEWFLEKKLKIHIMKKYIANYKKLILKHEKIDIFSFMATLKAMRVIFDAFKVEFNNEKSINYFINCLDIIVNTEFKSSSMRNVCKKFLGIN